MAANFAKLPEQLSRAAADKRGVTRLRQQMRCIDSLSCKLSSMKRERSQLPQVWLGAAQSLCFAGTMLVTLPPPLASQDIRGVELCTAETRMERRTGCLQANAEFLQQALNKLARETQDKITAADRDLAAARSEIAALKLTMEKLNSELEKMKANAEPNGKK